MDQEPDLMGHSLRLHHLRCTKCCSSIQGHEHILRNSRIRTPCPPLLLPLLRKSELEDRVQVLHNRRNHIIHLGIYRSNHRNTFRPILIHNQSLTITAIRPTLHPTTLVRVRLLLHGSVRLLHHGERADGLPRPILLRHILSHNQTTNKVVQLRDSLLLPVRPRQCYRRPSLGISLARPSLVHHLHHSNTDHLPSKRRSMEKAARNQLTKSVS